MRPLILLHSVSAMLWLGVIASAADRPAPESREPSDSSHDDTDAVLSFVRDQHPELARLLARLRSSSPEQFKKAIADIARTKTRLYRLKDQDPKRYDLALEIWSLDSRIRLLVARSIRSDENVRQEVRELLAERQKARLALLKLERDRLRTRLDQVETQMTRLQQRPEQALDADLNRILRNRDDHPPRERDSANAPRNKKRASRDISDTPSSRRSEREHR